MCHMRSHSVTCHHYTDYTHVPQTSTGEDLIKSIKEWKDNVENEGMRVNKNKTKVIISG